MKTEIDYSSHSYDDIAAPDQEEHSSFKMVRLPESIMLLFPSIIIIIILINALDVRKLSSKLVYRTYIVFGGSLIRD